MADALDRSMQAWGAALSGMRTYKPTYKASLIVAVLELLDADAVDGASPQILDADARLSATFDFVLSSHGALLQPGRWFMPRKHMAVRDGNPSDQIWIDGDGVLEVLEPFRAVLGSPTGREWLRQLVARELERRGHPTGLRLALRLRNGWHEEDERLQECADLVQEQGEIHEADANEAVRESLPSLEAYGMAQRASGGRWKSMPGDLATGRRIFAHLRAGNTSMTFLKKEGEVRQGQGVFRSLVLGNFDSWCAVCPIGMSEVLEAAHILPAKEYPEVGLDVRNGLSLCRNHHRVFDGYLLAVDNDKIVLSKELQTKNAAGVVATMSSLVRAHQVPLLAEGLHWRLKHLRA